MTMDDANCHSRGSLFSVEILAAAAAWEKWLANHFFETALDRNDRRTGQRPTAAMINCRRNNWTTPPPCSSFHMAYFHIMMSGGLASFAASSKVPAAGALQVVLQVTLIR